MEFTKAVMRSIIKEEMERLEERVVDTPEQVAPTAKIADATIKLAKEMQRRWGVRFSNKTVRVKTLNKFHKLIWVDSDEFGGQQSVAAFVDKRTGDVYRPASWKAPAKHARGNVLSRTKGFEALSMDGQVNYLR